MDGFKSEGTYKISKDFHFSASHVLSGLPSEHPCSRLHGHNYIIRIFLESETLNDIGFVVDYRDLEDIKDYINSNMDHRHLNDILPMNPTAENMAKWFYEQFKDKYPQIKSIEVSETPKSNARYEVINGK